jgi:hypothetical protein
MISFTQSDPDAKKQAPLSQDGTVSEVTSNVHIS